MPEPFLGHILYVLSQILYCKITELGTQLTLHIKIQIKLGKRWENKSNVQYAESSHEGILQFRIKKPLPQSPAEQTDNIEQWFD